MPEDRLSSKNKREENNHIVHELQLYLINGKLILHVFHHVTESKRKRKFVFCRKHKNKAKQLNYTHQYFNHKNKVLTACDSLSQKGDKTIRTTLRCLANALSWGHSFLFIECFPFFACTF